MYSTKLQAEGPELHRTTLLPTLVTPLIRYCHSPCPYLGEIKNISDTPIKLHIKHIYITL